MDASVDVVVKFFPTNPQRRGEVVLVNDERCRVTRCRVAWDGPTWTIKLLKVKPA